MNKYLSKYLFYYPTTILRGEHVEKYLKLYTAMQWSSPEAIADYQNKNLLMLLLHAQDTVPYYQKLFLSHGIDDINRITLGDLLSRLPVTSKQDIVKHARQLHSSRHYLRRSDKTTGGSTGEAVTITKNAEALARERAATWRAYQWAGVSIGDLQARFWGTPLTRKGRMFYKTVDFISNRVRLSAFNLSPSALDDYYKKLVEMRPAYLYGYVSMIVDFAKFIKASKYKPIPGLRSIITTSEVLDDTSKSQIESAFRVKVFNEYGCGEVGSIAHECEYGNMHVMAENVIIEIDSSDDPSGKTGKIIVTDLHNFAMPLIRYELGDYATLTDSCCPCGRGLPIISKIHGRAYDIIIDPAGNKHHPEILMYIFEALKSENAGIQQFQVIQSSERNLDITIVPDTSYQHSTEKEITTRIAQSVHPGFSVSIEYAKQIQREKSGKLRIIKSEIRQTG